MKYLGIVSDPNDLTNKQYVDDKVGRVSASLTTLSGRVDTTEDNIQMAESDIGDLQTETNTLKTDMTTVKGAVKTLQDTYVPNTTKVNGQALSEDVTIEAVQYTNQILTASQKTQARNNIGAGTSNFSGIYDDLVDKPTIPEGAFVAVYDTTTFEELQEAYNAQRPIYCYYSRYDETDEIYVYQLTSLDEENGAFFTTSGGFNATIETLLCAIDSTWDKSSSYYLLPTPSGAYEGYIMQIKNGIWFLEDPPFAKKSTTTLTTLQASSWSNGTYSFNNSYPSSSYDVTIEIDSSATDSQIEAWTEAKIVGSYNSNIFTAKGTVPTINIPIILTVQSV